LNSVRQERVFFLVVFVVIGVLALIVMQPFFTYMVLAGILTYILFPVYDFIERRLHRSELSSGLCIVIALLLMILPAVYLVTELVKQVSGAYSLFQPERFKQIAEYVRRLVGVDPGSLLENGIDQMRTSILAMAPNILGSITDLLLGLFVMFFVMFYGFREGYTFLAYLKQLLPLDPTLKESLFYELKTITQAVLYGQVMTAFIQGALGGLAMLAFGVGNWLFWGAIMMLTAFLPLLGTPIIWGPAGIGLIFEGETVRGVGLLIVGATIVMNVDNFIRPRLVSGRTKVHPVLILIGVLGGLKIFGFIGMLVGPLILALLVALIKFYEEAYVLTEKH
jgi:predicted PurR-regulated permease PerM